MSWYAIGVVNLSTTYADGQKKCEDSGASPRWGHSFYGRKVSHGGHGGAERFLLRDLFSPPCEPSVSGATQMPELAAEFFAFPYSQ